MHLAVTFVSSGSVMSFDRELHICAGVPSKSLPQPCVRGRDEKARGKR